MSTPSVGVLALQIQQTGIEVIPEPVAIQAKNIPIALQLLSVQSALPLIYDAQGRGFMHRFYGLARTALTIVATLVIVPVVGEFFIGLAKEYHLYEMPGRLPGTAMNWLQEILESPWLWSLGLFLAGLTIGMWLDTFVRRRASTPRVPHVGGWLDASDAIPKFADAKLTSEWKRARDRGPRLASEIDSLKKMLDEKKQEKVFRSDDDPVQILAHNAAVGYLAGQHRQAIDNLNKAGEEAWKKENEVLADIIAQLKRGTLVGKGFRHRLNRVADTAETIPLDHWQLLNFDTYDQKRQTVEGGGKKYVGLQIGRNENPPP